MSDYLSPNIEVVNTDDCDNHITEQPSIPYYEAIPLGGIAPGYVIIIQGTIPDGSRRFSLNLMVGSVITEEIKTSADIALHFNPRFDETIVIRNSRQNELWGGQEAELRVMPYTAGAHFETMILVDHNGYNVTVNGHHFCRYAHRISPAVVGVFGVEGDIQLASVEYRRQWCRPLLTRRPSHDGNQIVKPRLPFHHWFPEGLKPGHGLKVTGQVAANADRFAIDYVRFTNAYPHVLDIAFHMRVWFGRTCVDMNHCLDGEWGHELTVYGYQEPHGSRGELFMGRRHGFPFLKGEHIEVTVRTDVRHFTVEVNGHRFTDFPHRVPKVFDFINGLIINGDIDVHDIRFLLDDRRKSLIPS